MSYIFPGYVPVSPVTVKIVSLTLTLNRELEFFKMEK